MTEAKAVYNRPMCGASNACQFYDRDVTGVPGLGYCPIQGRRVRAYWICERHKPAEGQKPETLPRGYVTK